MIALLRHFTEFFSWMNSACRGTLRVKFVADLPDHLERHTLYAIGEEAPWSAAMICPCGCRSMIQMSLLPDDSPRWKMTISPLGLLTMAPSIWRTADCRAHFFLRRGHIVWCVRD